MSIRGNPYRWLQGALARGDLSGVRAAAVELERRVNLADALGIVLLMAAKRDPAYERAAAKWLVRFARERPQVGLDELKTALDALLLLRDGRTQAHHALRMLAGRQRLGDVIGLTDPPQAGNRSDPSAGT